MPGCRDEPRRISGALREKAGGSELKHLQVSASLTPPGCHGVGEDTIGRQFWHVVMRYFKENARKWLIPLLELY